MCRQFHPDPSAQSQSLRKYVNHIARFRSRNSSVVDDAGTRLRARWVDREVALDSTKATAAVVSYVLTLVVTYVAFGGRFPPYRTPLLLVLCVFLAFIVAIVVAFALLAQA